MTNKEKELQVISIESARLEDISFGEDDRNLFQVDDARLRAEALRHSVLPRLQVLLNKSLLAISNVYGVEVFNDSRESFYPQFRTKRSRELLHFYEAAYAGLGGQQVKGKWNGVQRKDGKIVQLLPFRYGFQLCEDGLCIGLENYWLKGLTDKSHRKFFAFHLEYEDHIHALCFAARITPSLAYGGSLEPISTFREHYKFMLLKKIYDNNFGSEFKNYPVTAKMLSDSIYQFTCFYPVYDSYLQIAMGRKVRFKTLLEKLNSWIKQRDELEEMESFCFENKSLSAEDIAKVREFAEQKIKVMPSIRWQVFQRDGWKCIACGRNADSGVILQVDHIIPRSKGGKNTLDNFQTLCHICNLGKSNRDSTDLRAVR